MTDVTKEVIRKEISSMTSSTKHKTGGFGGAGTGYMQVRVCFDFERDGLCFA